MTAIVMLGVFSICVLIGAPIGTAMCLSSVSALITSNMGLSMVPFNYYASISKFLLLAIPFFILAGNIMEKAGISTKLIKFAQSFVGHINGGLALVCVLVACFFAAISGSGPATVAALGGIIIPAMTSVGYSKGDASALMATARWNRNHHSSVHLLRCIQLDRKCICRNPVYGRYHSGTFNGILTFCGFHVGNKKSET